MTVNVKMLSDIVLVWCVCRLYDTPPCVKLYYAGKNISFHFYGDFMVFVVRNSIGRLVINWFFKYLATDMTIKCFLSFFKIKKLIKNNSFITFIIFFFCVLIYII